MGFSLQIAWALNLGNVLVNLQGPYFGCKAPATLFSLDLKAPPPSPAKDPLVNWSPSVNWRDLPHMEHASRRCFCHISYGNLDWNDAWQEEDCLVVDK